MAAQNAVYSQSEELASCNARHLALAEKHEQAVTRRVERANKLTDNGPRCVSAAAEAAQRIGRLALGVSTENLHTSHDPYAQMSDEEWLQSFSGGGSTRCNNAHRCGVKRRFSLTGEFVNIADQPVTRAARLACAQKEQGRIERFAGLFLYLKSPPRLTVSLSFTSSQLFSFDGMVGSEAKSCR